MGNKRLTDTGPVHSPISRHDAGGKNKANKAKTANQNKQKPNQNSKTKNQTKHKGNVNGWSVEASGSDSRLITLYHPRDWNGGWSKQTTRTITKTAIPNSVSKRSNTILSGNQGPPQPGAPKSHSVSRTGIGTHGVGAIQKLAMALPCSQWKGETKQSETECETDLW